MQEKLSYLERKMKTSIILLNFVLGFVLYLGNDTIGKFKTYSNYFGDYPSYGFDVIPRANFAEHFFQKIVHPAIYLAIIVALFQHLHHVNLAMQMWLVVPAYWLFRIIHILIWDLVPYTNWEYEILSLTISLLLSDGMFFLVLRPLMTSNESVFIAQTAFRDAFWFGAISYLAKKSWDILKSTLYGETLFPRLERNIKFVRRYNKFKKKYGEFIDNTIQNSYAFDCTISQTRFLYILYSIMIYEDHCRPKLVRIGEYFLKLFRRNRIMSLGIMQVQTKRFISNKESIELAIARLYAVFSTEKGAANLYNTIHSYNRGERYYNNVFMVFSAIEDEYGYSE